MKYPPDTPRFRDWACDCGWDYHSPVPLIYPPTHRCKPTIPRSKTLTPIKETP